MLPKGSIYTLSDPRDGAIRYVGKTMKPLPERLAGHLSSPTNPAMRLWISTLAARGLAPVIKLAATASEDKLSAKEERLIYRHARDGHRLFNSPYYRQYMSDLIGSDVEPENPTPIDPVREFYQAQYGPVAAAHIAHRISGKRAAWEVARRIPRVACFTLWQLPAVRCVTRIALVAAYLRCIGFDRLLKAEVLAKPWARDAGSFAAEYFAAPACTLGLHALVALVGWSAFAYREVRAETARKMDEQQKFVSPLDADLAAAAAAALDRALLR